MINTKVAIGTVIGVMSFYLLSTNGGPIEVYLMNGQKAIKEDGSI